MQSFFSTLIRILPAILLLFLLLMFWPVTLITLIIVVRKARAEGDKNYGLSDAISGLIKDLWRYAKTDPDREEKNLRYVCPDCGSEDINISLEGEWNVLNQEWEQLEFRQTCVTNYCNQCEVLIDQPDVQWFEVEEKEA